MHAGFLLEPARSGLATAPTVLRRDIRAVACIVSSGLRRLWCLEKGKKPMHIIDRAQFQGEQSEAKVTRIIAYTTIAIIDVYNAM